MADRLNIEISGRLVPLLLQLARRQGRGPDEITEEAVWRYLKWVSEGTEPGPGIGRELEEIYVDPPEEPARRPEDFLLGLFQQIDREQRERGVDPLSQEEAMRLADEELHAMRREGGAGRKERIEQ
jgi:hypothetical protein